mgnify:CR=1 FL=1
MEGESGKRQSGTGRVGHSVTMSMHNALHPSRPSHSPPRHRALQLSHEPQPGAIGGRAGGSTRTKQKLKCAPNSALAALRLSHVPPVLIGYARRSVCVWSGR